MGLETMIADNPVRKKALLDEKKKKKMFVLHSGHIGIVSKE